jgi:hypothetical protein
MNVVYFQVSEYNVPYGKKNRGLAVVQSYRYLARNSCTDEGVKLAMIIGWCIEWVRVAMATGCYCVGRVLRLGDEIFRCNVSYNVLCKACNIITVEIL